MVPLPNLVLGIGCQEVKCGDVKPELSGLGELSEACSERNQIFPRDIGGLKNRFVKRLITFRKRLDKVENCFGRH